MFAFSRLFKNLKNRNLLIKEHILLLFVFSLLYYKLSQYSNNQKDIKKFSIYEQCVYFTVVTHFTVGFGDIAPKSNFLRRICILQIICAFLLFNI
jgi:hypothetical protein